MKRCTVAVLGLSVRGEIHLRGLLENPDQYQVVGLCGRDEFMAQKVAEGYGLTQIPLFTNAEQLLFTVRPDIFVLITYPSDRLNMVELVVWYDVRGISLEKPMTEPLQEAKVMRDLCHQHGVRAVVCHQQKYLSQMRRMKQRIEAGEVEEIRKIHVETQAQSSQLGICYVDYTLQINGGYPAKWVVGHVHDPATLEGFHPTPDYLLGTMELKNRVRTYIECGYSSEAYNPPEYASSDNRLIAYGADRHIYAKADGFQGACAKVTNERLVEGKDPGWRNHQQMLTQIPYYTEFVEWIDDDPKPHSYNVNTSHHGYEILKTMCLNALNYTRINLSIQGLSCTSVLERMRTMLSPCETQRVKLYGGEVPRKERDQVMKNTTEKELLVNGNSFHVEITGQGTPLVLITGLGAPGEKWNQNAKVYTQHFQCTTLDNRKVGRSDEPKAEAYFTIEMAGDILGTMDALEISQAHMNGVSMGGAIAQHLTARHPHGVRSLVLTSTSASVSNSFRRAIEALKDSMEQLDKTTFRRLDQWTTFPQSIQNTYRGMFWKAERQGALYLYPMPAYTYRAQCNACLAHSTTLELCRITSPTLIATGFRDLFMPTEKTMELYGGITTSELYLCKNDGHVHQWKQPEAYNRAVLDFLLWHDRQKRRNQKGGEPKILSLFDSFGQRG